MLENTQSPLHVGGQDQILRTEKKHRLDDHLKKTGCPRVFPLLAQDPCHPCPTILILSYVARHHRPVVVPPFHNLYHILEQGDCIQLSPVGLEGPLLNIHQLLLSQTYALPLLSLSALGGGDVTPIKCTPGHHNVASGSPWVGEVSFFQNDDGFTYITVEEMNPRCHPRCRPSQTPLDGEFPRSPGNLEDHHVATWLPTRGRGFPIPSPNRFLPMMCLQMDHPRPEHHILLAICALYLNPLPLSVGRPRYRHPYPACRLRLHSRLLAREEYHSDCLPDVVLQAHPVKHPYQGATRH